MTSVLRYAADALDAVGLGEPAFRIFQRLQAAAFKDKSSDPGLPPPLLRVLTAGTADPDVFIAQGRHWANFLGSVAKSHGFEESAESVVLEFGCGSGRAARWWIEQYRCDFHGCDIQSRLVAWCSKNLGGKFSTNDLEPPLAYQSETFDLIYAISVFTHLGEDMSAQWFSELARVVKTGGLALITFHDELSSGAETVNHKLLKSGFAVRRSGAEGGNLLSVFYSAGGIAERAGPNWQVQQVIGSQETGGGQALAVLKKI